MSITGAAANAARPAEFRARDNWVRQHLRVGSPLLPFSFRYGGRSGQAVLASAGHSIATKQLDPARRQTTITWRDAATGLEARCVAVDYADYPAVEWTLYLRNAGASGTPLIEDLQGLDVRMERRGSREFALHGIKGDWCVAESYAPYSRTLGPGAAERFSPPDGSGKSCDGPAGWPYFNLGTSDGGVMLAVGWPGQWAASFVRDAGAGLQVRAGQQLTRFTLKPGEEVRTPLIALVFWQGADVVRAQNLWRRWYVAHNLPRVGGKPHPPVSQIQVGGGDASAPELLAYQAAGVHPDICWRDAGGETTWYPSGGGPYKGGDAWLNTGTWEVDPARYPQGFRPFSDRVRQLGSTFLLWFEPERVGDPNSWLATKHPEWMLPGTSHGALLDEGNPAARAWLIDHVDRIIRQQGLDWYREDMNGGGPLPAWRRNDAPDRQGITENLYVQGHLAFWDALKRRNPRLLIDSCASGGRRNDLETMRRAVPLLRSDFQFPTMAGVVEGNQGHTYGLSFWLPWYGTGVYGVDPYTVRSFLMPGFGVVPPGGWEQTEAGRAAVKRAYDEARAVGPLMLGDYYPLTPYSLQTDRWMAWQFHRPAEGDGVVQAFRRAGCADAALMCRLQGLNPAERYSVRNLDEPDARTVSGADLMAGLRIELPAAPSAAVFLYRRASTAARSAAPAAEPRSAGPRRAR